MGYGSGNTQLDRLRRERDAARKAWEDKGRPRWQAARERTRKAQAALERKRADRDRILGEREDAIHRSREKGSKGVAVARAKLVASRQRHDELVQRATDHVERMEERERVLYEESVVLAHEWDDLAARVKDLEGELGVVG